MATTKKCTKKAATKKTTKKGPARAGDKATTAAKAAKAPTAASKAKKLAQAKDGAKGGKTTTPTAAKGRAKIAKPGRAQRSGTAAVGGDGGDGGEVTVTIPLDSLPAEEAAEAKDAALGSERASSPTAAAEVEVLSEEEARKRDGNTDIIKTLKGKDAAVRQAIKAGGFVIAHEDGRYSAARTGEPSDPLAEASQPDAPAKPKAEAKASEQASKGGRGAKAIKGQKEPKPQMSAVDAAAQVLAKAKKPMRAKELIEQMAKQGLWTSPGGKTPEATLYAAMVREISKKGNDARFRKHDRGAFVATGKGG